MDINIDQNLIIRYFDDVDVDDLQQIKKKKNLLTQGDESETEKNISLYLRIHSMRIVNLDVIHTYHF